MKRKAVSQIIAALLLIAIAVAATILLYVFSIGILGTLGPGTTENGSHTLPVDFMTITTTTTTTSTLGPNFCAKYTIYMQATPVNEGPVITPGHYIIETDYNDFSNWFNTGSGLRLYVYTYGYPHAIFFFNYTPPGTQKIVNPSNSTFPVIYDCP